MNQQMIMKIKKMQKEMQETQAMIEASSFEGSVSGVVKVTIMGNRQISEIKIDDAFTIEDEGDKELLQDSIVAASSQAYEKLDKFTEEHMGKYTAMVGGGGLF